MATYKVVDADQLDADMTGLADTIRTKGGTSADLAWPEGYKSAVEAIGTGGGGDQLDALIERSATEIVSNAKSVGASAFYGWSDPFSVDLPQALIIYADAFYQCKGLISVSVPRVTRINNYAFRSCSALTEVVFPSAEAVALSAFRDCSALKMADFPRVYNFTSDYIFYNCTNLQALLLRRDDIACNLPSTNVLGGTPIESGVGYIYVPSALVDTYKAATNWSTYAAQFRALEDYTVDGTITGELDPTKTGT